MTEATSLPHDDDFSGGSFAGSDADYDGASYTDGEVMNTHRSSQRKGLYGVVENKLFGLAENGKAEIANSFQGIVEIVREMASRVEGLGGGPVAAYANEAVELLDDLHAQLRDKPVDELLDDGRELIRTSPGVAIGVAVFAGFIAARLVKAGGR